MISFNGSLWDVLLRCSKWLLGAWLDSFTMILRCWLVVWVKWARPLVSMTLWSRVMFNWKAVQLKGRPISWAVLHHWKSMGQILVPSCPPGVQLLPHFEVWSYRACQPLQMWPISHFCEIHSLSYEASNFFRNVKSMGQIWDAPAPQGCNFYPILRCGLTEPASLFKCGKFQTSVKIHSLSYEASKFFAMLSQCVWFAPILPLGQISYPRSLIKVIAHDSRLGRTFWHLIHGSVTKTVGGVARRNKSGRRRRIITRMYISRRKCEWCLQWQKTPPGC